MKKVMIALALAAFTATGAMAQTAATPQQTDVKKVVDKNAPKFAFIGDETFNFGELTDKKDAEHVFRFKNSGKTPLIISNASASCGCTVPEFPKEPIMPGKEGQIKVTFHTAGKSGPFQKTVFIQSNASADKERYEIYIKGNVTPTGQPVNASPTKS